MLSLGPTTDIQYQQLFAILSLIHYVSCNVIHLILESFHVLISRIGSILPYDIDDIFDCESCHILTDLRIEAEEFCELFEFPFRFRRNITMIALVDAEKVALDETVEIMRKTRRRRTLLFALLISLIIILGALYYYLPWIAEKLGLG